MKSEMVVQLNRYFEEQDPQAHFFDVEISEVHALVTLLDPRYKMSGFVDIARAEAAKGKLADFASNIVEGSLTEIFFKMTPISPRTVVGMQF